MKISGAKVVEIIDHQTIRIKREGAFTPSIVSLNRSIDLISMLYNNTRDELEAFMRVAKSYKYSRMENDIIDVMRARGMYIDSSLEPKKSKPQDQPKTECGFTIVRLVDPTHFLGENDGRNYLVKIGQWEKGNSNCVSYKRFGEMLKKLSLQRQDELGIQMEGPEFAYMRKLLQKTFRGDEELLSNLGLDVIKR
jgi:hypothetical protein